MRMVLSQRSRTNGAHQNNIFSALPKAPGIIFLSMVTAGVTAFDYQTCGKNTQNGIYGTTIGLDAHGDPVANISEAKGVNYTTCLRVCGSGSQRFEWSIFSAIQCLANTLAFPSIPTSFRCRRTR
jgi:hypothetical protein